ncbi:MAG TPA: lipoate--protein ligase [Phycisphaerae bacterium]|nr:lipoate--protein ligase [Phycisphaerae bacterium]
MSDSTPPRMPVRWLIDPPADGPTNMARDEAILTCVGSGGSPPTLRFYRWEPPTISLGYFQEYCDFAALPPPAGALPVVRRITGGGAILHDRELTYSLTVPVGHALMRAAGPNALYDLVHNAVAALLASRGITVRKGPAGRGGCSHGGPFFCFERHSCFDLLAGECKLMGSAQRRAAGAVLQHGSLILEKRFEQQICAAIADLAGLDIDAHLRELAESVFGISVGDPGAYIPEERRLAEQLRDKYADSAWTRRR